MSGLDFASPVEIVPGIGEKTGASLRKAGIKTLHDLAYHFPRDYLNFEHITKIADARPGQIVVKGQVTDLKTFISRRGLKVVRASIRDQSGALGAIWFNQSFRTRQLKSKAEFYFTGELRFNRGRYALSNPRVSSVEQVANPNHYSIKPVYPAIGEIAPHDFSKFMQKAKSLFAQVNDALPNLPGRADALLNMHFPLNEQDFKSARRYFALEEMFYLILAARLSKDANAKLKTFAIPSDLPALKQFVRTLPFTLTDAQRLAGWEIIQDLAKTKPMNRLLEGDVGSGKTIVAAMAILTATRAGFQTALMAPTEVLAIQHAQTLRACFKDQVRIALLSSATKNKAKLKQDIQSGKIDLVIGTHAILTDDTIFAKLGLAIIDEQHRFGVNQRQKLLLKARTLPHLLTMTATPIPRSLQLTIFGDLDVSILHQMPKGRQPVSTQILTPNSLSPMWAHLKSELEKGHQIYYICRKIDDKGLKEAESVALAAKNLGSIFPQARIATLHGRMKSLEKERIMQAFSAHQTDILVSTTVVEVGMNVANASVIVIANADQYGLAQLHQLRGRVGRSDIKSFCYFINTNDNPPSSRLREIARTQDGFKLAELDLKLRGPGEIYGELQHGALDIRLASLSDTKLIKEARALVDDFINKSYSISASRELAESIRKYQRLTSLN